ncbi:endonuclease III, partial [Paragonimus westermani]
VCARLISLRMSRTRSVKNTPAEVPDIENLHGWKPKFWQKHLENIVEMRKSRDAPVDTMGCERLADRQDYPENFRLQVLISLMLSSQTKDHITASAMHRLQSVGCNLDTIVPMEHEELEQLIYPVGFYKVDHYLSSLTATSKKRSVGPKMAHLVMRCAWNEVTGIAVDTHVHRIVNRLQWTKKPTKTPEDTRKALEAWLPREHWDRINWLLVGFGQQRCLPVSPRCEDCLNKVVCPVGRKTTTTRLSSK